MPLSTSTRRQSGGLLQLAAFIIKYIVGIGLAGISLRGDNGLECGCPQAGVRLFSIDGCHTVRATRIDLALAAASLAGERPLIAPQVPGLLWLDFFSFLAYMHLAPEDMLCLSCACTTHHSAQSRNLIPSAFPVNHLRYWFACLRHTYNASSARCNVTKVTSSATVQIPCQLPFQPPFQPPFQLSFQPVSHSRYSNRRCLNSGLLT